MTMNGTWVFIVWARHTYALKYTLRHFGTEQWGGGGGGGGGGSSGVSIGEMGIKKKR